MAKQHHHPLDSYLRDLRDIRATGAGVKETSFYPPLSTLLTAVGSMLKPAVRCVINLQNQGEGMPDGGFFTPDQFERELNEIRSGQKPSRGALEVKGTEKQVDTIANLTQVNRYREGYGQVLVTNLREFLLVGTRPGGGAILLERYALATSETEFWNSLQNIPAVVATHGERLTEFLQRAMLHAAPLDNPKDLAWFLAGYARDARARIQAAVHATDALHALESLRAALEEALGLKFEGDKGHHFFQSTLVQTLFYGVFSAWVMWCRHNPPTDTTARFDWRSAEWNLHVPMIRSLFEQVATPSKLGPLNLVETLDWTTATLHRVDRAVFFSRFEQEMAVQYFYEPFLEAFDPALRKDLGVWYTPPEIVRYQVERVHQVLQSELGIPDGLADSRVHVLDPCCGTGAYLVEVLRCIDRTLQANGADALAATDLKQAAITRIFGFEILTAPFVVAHLQLGLLLHSFGVPLAHARDERIPVYLTNALTGWIPPAEPNPPLAIPEMQTERDAADRVKRNAPILVVIGNPPYNAFAGVSPQEELGMVDIYKQGLREEWGIKKFNLDDLYIRFFRMAERRIAEVSGRGVVSFISNFSYLSDPSFVVMRQRFLQEFDVLWFDNMNGDSRETGKLTPEGKPDPSVFSTEYNREGIRVGTAISTMVRRESRLAAPAVHYREFWGAAKRINLSEIISQPATASPYTAATPTRDNRFSFRPVEVSGDYLQWPRLTELCAEPPNNGLMEKRGGALIDIDPKALEERIRAYYNPTVSWEQLATMYPGLTKDAAGYNAQATRHKVQASEMFSEDHLVRYAMRPLETLWCYYSAVSPLWNRSRPTLWAQCWQGNAFLLSRMKASKTPEGSPLYFASIISDDHLLSPDAACFAIRLRTGGGSNAKRQGELVLEEEPSIRANLSPRVRAYLAGLGITDVDTNAGAAEAIWMHALAVGYAPEYLSANADGIRGDWPRIPLPDSRQKLERSAAIGREVAALLDTEREIPGVTAGTIRLELRGIGAIAAADGNRLNPEEDLTITARWGSAGKEGVTMPGRGKFTKRDYTPQEQQGIVEGAAALGLTPEEALQRLGHQTMDIYLNDRAYWRNIPVNVWECWIGGYQVIKKWLSYRENSLLGRPLATAEVREVGTMARRLAALRLLEPMLDANYRSITEGVHNW